MTSTKSSSGQSISCKSWDRQSNSGKRQDFLWVKVQSIKILQDLRPPLSLALMIKILQDLRFSMSHTLINQNLARLESFTEQGPCILYQLRNYPSITWNLQWIQLLSHRQWEILCSIWNLQWGNSFLFSWLMGNSTHNFMIYLLFVCRPLVPIDAK